MPGVVLESNEMDSRRGGFSALGVPLGLEVIVIAFANYLVRHLH
jgi:hypothetical protein